MRPTKFQSRRSARQQAGITLLIGLLMLIMLTLMGIAAFKMSNMNSMVAANSQHRMEATRAAEQALEAMISTSVVLESAPTGWTKNTANNTYESNVQVDVNGGGATYNVQLVRTPCVSSMSIKNSLLNIDTPEDLACVMGVGQNFGVAGAATVDSLCSEVVREARATSTDPLQQTRVEVVLGFGARVATDNIAQSCN